MNTKQITVIVDRLIAYSDIRRNDPRESKSALHDLIVSEIDAYVAQEVARLVPALIRARDGYIAEAATGLLCTPTWRHYTMTKLDEAIELAAAMRARGA